MDYSIFTKLYKEAKNVELEKFLTDYISILPNSEIMTDIWEMARGGINVIIKKSKRRFAASFSRDFCVPHRTLQRWQQNDSAPQHILMAFAYIVIAERELR